ncbi:MAG: alpha/beta hydrolase [Myxococcales bacterium FL481]|nr:MAG: alpha/beta hydrolase [Myxococcales bacterium FL481]
MAGKGAKCDRWHAVVSAVVVIGTGRSGFTAEPLVAGVGARSPVWVQAGDRVRWGSMASLRCDCLVLPDPPVRRRACRIRARGGVAGRPASSWRPAGATTNCCVPSARPTWCCRSFADLTQWFGRCRPNRGTRDEPITDELRSPTAVQTMVSKRRKIATHRFSISLGIGLLFGGCHHVAPPSSPEIQGVDGTPIAYRASGSGDVALLFIHGWCGDKSYWDGQRQAFSPDYRTVAVDLAGHGDSGGREDRTVASLVRDIGRVMDVLALNRTVLVGHSMGATIALESALAHPARVVGLVGVDAFKDIESEIDRGEFERFVGSLENNFSEVASGFVRDGLFVADSPDVVVERVVADVERADPKLAVGLLRDVVHYWSNEAASLARLEVPVVFVNSGVTSNNVDAWRRHVPDHTAHYLPTGHFPMLEDPALFNRQLGLGLEVILGADRAHGSSVTSLASPTPRRGAQTAASEPADADGDSSHISHRPHKRAERPGDRRATVAPRRVTAGGA